MHFLVPLVALLLFAAPFDAHGQASDSTTASGDRYSMVFRGVPLDEALQTLVRRADVDLAYSTTLVRGRTVYCRAQSAALDTLLSCILRGTGVESLQTESGSYILVESPRTAPPVGRIAGTVVDAATGEPLSNANVLLADAGTGTATNEAGQFAVAPVLAGTHRLVVTYVGYRTAIDSVRVPPNGRDTVRVTLSRRVLDTDPVIVDGLQQRLPSGRLGKSQLDASALTTLSSGGTADVLRQVGGQIGVSVNRPLAEVNVQGGDSGEHVVFLDGMPVREPVSLGGLLTAFSPEALERVTVHKAGFGAVHGSYTAGVLEARHDLARKDARYGALAIDALSANGRADLEWETDGARGNAMIAGRSSMWGAYREPSLHELLDTRTMLDRPLTPSWTGTPVSGRGAVQQRQTAHVQFADLHGAVRQQLGPFEHLVLSGYRGTTGLGTNVVSVLPETTTDRLLLSRDDYDWANTALQGRYNWLASSRVSGSVQLRASWHNSSTFFGIRRDSLQQGGVPAPRTARGDIESHSSEGNRIAEWGGEAAVDVSVTSDLHLRAAVSPQHIAGDFRVRNPFLGILDHESSDWHVGGYAEAELSPGYNLTLTGGTRLTYVRARGAIYGEPRVSLRYDRSSTAVGGLAVRLAGGLYRQYVMQSDVTSAGPTSVVPSIQFWLPVDRSVAPATAYHTAGSVLIAPTNAWSARLETYYKWQPRTLHVDYPGLVRIPQGTGPPPRRAVNRQAQFMAAGQGYAYGAAVQVQREGKRITGRGSVEWSQVNRRYPGRFGGRYVPAPWERPLQLTATVEATMIDGLSARAHWEGTWGRSWALRRAYYDYLALANSEELGGYDLSRPGTQSLDPFSRLDLGLIGTTTLGGVTLEAEVSLVNVLGRDNPFDQSLNFAGSESTPVHRTLPGRRAFVLFRLQY